jgi:hypothetical protein
MTASSGRRLLPRSLVYSSAVARRHRIKRTFPSIPASRTAVAQPAGPGLRRSALASFELRRLRSELRRRRMRRHVRCQRRSSPRLFGGRTAPTGCVVLRSNSNDCGTARTVCKQGTACADGSCTQACPAGANCEGSCVELSNDANHCGACNQAGAAGQACVDAACIGIDSYIAGMSGAYANCGTEYRRRQIRPGQLRRRRRVRQRGLHRGLRRLRDRSALRRAMRQHQRRQPPPRRLRQALPHRRDLRERSVPTLRPAADLGIGSYLWRR